MLVVKLYTYGLMKLLCKEEQAVGQYVCVYLLHKPLPFLILYMLRVVGNFEALLFY